MFPTNVLVYFSIIIPIVLIVPCSSIGDASTTLSTSNTDPTIVSANAPHRHGPHNNSLNVITVNTTPLAKHFFIGNNTGLKRIHRERIEYYPIPWMRREKVYDYEDEQQRIIKAIYCYDYKRTEAEVEILSGGVGFSHISLLFTSAPSYGLDFAIEIFA